MFDSTGTWGREEKEELIRYCSEHLEEFKEFAHDTLKHPEEWNHHIPSMCDVLLKDDAEKIKQTSKPIDDSVNVIELLHKAFSEKLQMREWGIWQSCNVWLNYFEGTTGVDYYKDYVEYKEYLHRHFIGWSPNKEDDPNPTYEEFVNNREKYKI